MGNNLTDELRAKGGRNAQSIKRQTRSWYMKQLLDIAMGRRKCTGPQLTALCKFAEQRGWYPPTNKRNVISARNLKKLASKPAVTDDLSARINALIPKPQPVQSLPLIVTQTQSGNNLQSTARPATNA